MNEAADQSLPERPGLEELTQLHAKLSVVERDELLQCLLIAAPRGGEAMIEVLEDEPLCYATEELLREPLKGGKADR